MYKRNKLAVIGSPIKHSLSPAMHNAVIADLNLDFEYSAVEVEESKLFCFLEKAKREYRGFNVTVPYKQRIIPLLDRVSDNSSLSGSVNTVIVDDNGCLIGDTTDGFGLSSALKEIFNVDINNNSFLFVGCGGAAQAVSTYLLEKKAKRIFFVNRTLEKAEAFGKKLISHFGKSNINACSYGDRKKILAFLRNSKPVVIQSTSLGLRDDDPAPLSEEFFFSDLVYFDMIYNRNTKFLEYAKKYSCMCSDGKLMLLYQGAKSFEMWTGIAPPVETMKKTLFSSIK